MGERLLEVTLLSAEPAAGEVVLNVFEKLKSDKVIPVVDAVTKVGANYSSPMHPFDDYSITAGRVITGANPAGARSAAETVVKAFDNLQEGESTLKNRAA